MMILELVIQEQCGVAFLFLPSGLIEMVMVLRQRGRLFYLFRADVEKLLEGGAR